jgi:hypothetical protein
MPRIFTAILLAAWILPGCSPEKSADSTPSKTGPAKQAGPAAPADAVKAEVGVGKRGRGYDTGPVATPVGALFSTKERLVFDIQIPQAMGLYKAEHGNAPKTHEEFMQQIVKANNLKLPELPEGSQYRYFPDKEELMVVRPGP